MRAHTLQADRSYHNEKQTLRSLASLTVPFRSDCKWPKNARHHCCHGPPNSDRLRERREHGLFCEANDSVRVLQFVERSLYHLPPGFFCGRLSVPYAPSRRGWRHHGLGGAGSRCVAVTCGRSRHSTSNTWRCRQQRTKEIRTDVPRMCADIIRRAKASRYRHVMCDPRQGWAKFGGCDNDQSVPYLDFGRLLQRTKDEHVSVINHCLFGAHGVLSRSSLLLSALSGHKDADLGAENDWPLPLFPENKGGCCFEVGPNTANNIIHHSNARTQAEERTTGRGSSLPTVDIHDSVIYMTA